MRADGLPRTRRKVFAQGLIPREARTFIALTVTVLVATSSFPNPTRAQGAPSGQSANARSKAATSHGQALRSKYRIDRLRLTEKAGRAEGYFSAWGDLTPSAVSDQIGRARAIEPRGAAAQFLSENQSLLGLHEVASELREFAVHTDPNSHRTHITYHRYVGPLRIKEMAIQVHLEADSRISAVNGNIVHVPDECKAATNRLKDTLSESEVRAIIEADLQGGGIERSQITSIAAELVATVTPPYVVWDADVAVSRSAGRWIYQIGAFTGRVLHKRLEIQSHRQGL